MGVNLALFYEHDERVEFCLFDSVNADRESHRIVLPVTNLHMSVNKRPEWVHISLEGIMLLIEDV